MKIYYKRQIFDYCTQFDIIKLFVATIWRLWLFQTLEFFNLSKQARHNGAKLLLNSQLTFLGFFFGSLSCSQPSSNFLSQNVIYFYSNNDVFTQIMWHFSLNLQYPFQTNHSMTFSLKNNKLQPKNPRKIKPLFKDILKYLWRGPLMKRSTRKIIKLTLFIAAMGIISPYMSITWQQPVEIGLR